MHAHLESMLCTVTVRSGSKFSYMFYHSVIDSQMATTSKFDLVAALKRSVVKKEPRFIKAADVDLHGR